LLPGRRSPLCDEELALSWFFLPEYYWSTLRLEEVADDTVVPKQVSIVHIEKFTSLSSSASRLAQGA
jgi:hypothetical protein